MRLLQASIRSLLLYSLVLVVVSIPLSLIAIREILNEEVDETLALHGEQFIKHIKSFEYLDDLEMDLAIWDELSYDISIRPGYNIDSTKHYQTVSLYDSSEHEVRPFRILSSRVDIKNKPYVLTIQMSLVENDQLIAALSVVQFILVVLLTVGLLLINRSLSRRLWKPFYHTLNQLKAYQLDKGESIEFLSNNIVEFEDLNKAVQNLTERNREVFLQQKEFIENASHELQTPIAIFQTKLEILMQAPYLEEAESRLIIELEETGQRMSKLNKSLLLLSKIDNDQFTMLEQLDVAVLVRKSLTSLVILVEPSKLIIKTEIDATPIIANRILLEVLLTNIFHNAFRHTDDGGEIIVSLKDNSLTVRNSGVPLKMSTTKMFERFSKETNNPGSSGLGLAIVKKICDSCQFGLDYKYDDGFHTFVIQFSD